MFQIEIWRVAVRYSESFPVPIIWGGFEKENVLLSSDLTKVQMKLFQFPWLQFGVNSNAVQFKQQPTCRKRQSIMHLVHAQSRETQATIVVPPVCRKHELFMCWSCYLGFNILAMNTSCADAEVEGPKLTEPEQSQLIDHPLTGACEP